MNLIKCVVLGSTASLLALNGAQAVDLPVKAKAVEHVRNREGYARALRQGRSGIGGNPHANDFILPSH
jgi:hypothetical protein